MPSFRAGFSVGGVFTGGSPIGRFAIPSAIPVLALEHEQDPVPRSEGRDNPDLPHWSTVHRDLTDTLDALDAAGQQAAWFNATEYFRDPIAPGCRRECRREAHQTGPARRDGPGRPGLRPASPRSSCSR